MLNKKIIWRTLHALVASISLLIFLPICDAQSAPEIFSGTVVDAQGAPIADAEMKGADGKVLGTTTSDGSFRFTEPVEELKGVQVSALAYGTVTVTILPKDQSRIVLIKQAEEHVIVTAYRSPLDTLDSPASTRVLDQQQVQEARPAAEACRDHARAFPVKLKRKTLHYFLSNRGAGVRRKS